MDRINFELVSSVRTNQTTQLSAIASLSTSEIITANDRTVTIYNRFEMLENSSSPTPIQILTNVHSEKIQEIVILNVNQFLTASDDNRVKLFNRNEKGNFEEANELVPPHSGKCRGVIRVRDDLVISGGWDSTLKMWLYMEDSFMNVSDTNASIQVNGLCLLDETEFLAVGGNGKIILWRITGGGLELVQTMTNTETWINQAKAISKNEFIASHDSGTITRWRRSSESSDFRLVQTIKSFGWFWGIDIIDHLEFILVGEKRILRLTRKTQDGDFTIVQTMNENSNPIYRCLVLDEATVLTTGEINGFTIWGRPWRARPGGFEKEKEDLENTKLTIDELELRVLEFEQRFDDIERLETRVIEIEKRFKM